MHVLTQIPGVQKNETQDACSQSVKSKDTALKILAQYSQIVSNCCVNFSAESVHSNCQNHDLSRRLAFGKVANVISQVERFWWTKITSLTKNAVKQLEINGIT